jgi:electron transfer flavoprotein alpha subunit
MVLVFIETREGKVKKSSWETLGEAGRRAAELGEPAAAVLVGPAMDCFNPEVFSRGADKVFLLENAQLAEYSAQGFAIALADLVRETNPQAVFFAATAMGRDLAPRLAARIGVAVASDCVKIEVRDGRLEFTRPIFAGKAFLIGRLISTPQILTLRPNVFAAQTPVPGAAGGEVITLAAAVPDGAIKGRAEGLIKGEGEEIDVTEAEVIVSGGRGMKGPENFELLRGLAAVIPRSAVGASRSAVDSGWIDHGHQVGQTGKTVSPNLYMAFGISGAIQHLAGMSSAKVIVAVNKDPDAPIFKVADYGIVGDLFQVIPPLTVEIKKLFE